MICAINTAAREPTGGNDEHKLCNSESPDDCIAPGILTPDTNGRFELPGKLEANTPVFKYRAKVCAQWMMSLSLPPVAC